MSPTLWYPTLPSCCQVTRLSVSELPTPPAPKGSTPGRGAEPGQLWGSPAARGSPGDDGKAPPIPPATHIHQPKESTWVSPIFGGGIWGGPPLGLFNQAVGWPPSHPSCPQGMVATLSHTWGPGQLWGGFEGLSLPVTQCLWSRVGALGWGW